MLAAAWRSIGAPALCLAIGFALGWGVHEKQDQAAAAKRHVQVVAQEARADQATAKAGTEQQAVQERIRTVTHTIKVEVPVYVTPEADRRAVVPVGFVRLHDAAAAGVPPSPDPAGRAPDAPSGVALSAVAETVADNYGACHAWIARAQGWEAWWRAQEAIATGSLPATQTTR